LGETKGAGEMFLFRFIEAGLIGMARQVYADLLFDSTEFCGLAIEGAAASRTQSQLPRVLVS
jgi:hypothetical protein